MKRNRPIDGAKVQRLREDLEEMPTQEMMARSTGLTRQTVSEIENNKRPNANRSTIMALAEYLGVKPFDLLVAPSGATEACASSSAPQEDQSVLRTG